VSRPIRVLLADDHPVVRDGLRGMLASESDIEVVGEASDGAALVDLAVMTDADVALVDLRMPVMDGVQAASRLREVRPTLKVLILTTYDTDADIRRAIEAGATGYLLKDAPREELLRAVRATAAGRPYLAPSVAARLMDRVREPPGEPLSVREIEVLELVARGATNKDVARRLKLSEATVKSHLLHVFAKLGAGDRTQAVTLAVRKGIIRLDDAGTAIGP
jgi:DNA-binding NarL/FixJ family response regulator